MASIAEQLSNAKNLLENFTNDFEEDLSNDAPSIENSSADEDEADETVIEPEVVTNDVEEDSTFTKVGKAGKAVKRSASVTPLFTEKLRSGLKESSFGKKFTVTTEPEEKFFKLDTFTFGKIDKKEFDKSIGNKPNYMLNPILFQKGIKALSEKLNVNIYPDVDLFADEFNQQPGVKQFFHYDQSKRKDKNYDAFTQDWEQFKFVYANFFWGKMHDVILKAKQSKVNLITFLDLSPNATSLEYYKLYEEHCRCQYNFSNLDDLWIHASKEGYFEFMSSHLPKSDGQYALCFFNFHDEKIVDVPKTKVVNPPTVNDGRLSKKITTSVKNGDKISAHQSKNGTVTLTRVVNEARNISHDDSQESEEDVIKNLEFEIEATLKSKNLVDESVLYKKKKEQFEKMKQEYHNYLVKFEALL